MYYCECCCDCGITVKFVRTLNGLWKSVSHSQVQCCVFTRSSFYVVLISYVRWSLDQVLV